MKDPRLQGTHKNSVRPKGSKDCGGEVSDGSCRNCGTDSLAPKYIAQKGARKTAKAAKK